MVKEETGPAPGSELAAGGGAGKKIPTMCSIAQLRASWWEGLFVSGAARCTRVLWELGHICGVLRRAWCSAFLTQHR